MLSVPSSRKLFAASREPDALTPLLLPSLDSREPGAGGAAPGDWKVNCRKSRSSTGIITSVRPSNDSPIALDEDRRRLTSALTVIDSSNAPGTRTMSRLPLPPASSRRSVTTSFLNPAFDAVAV